MSDLTKVLNALLECWPVKALVSIFIFMIGDFNPSLAAICVLVFLDLLTKWMAVSRQTIEQNNLDCNLVGGFFEAWRCKALNSHSMRIGFVSKVFAYLILLSASYQMTKILPPDIIFGVDWSRAPDNFIRAFLAITEMISMVENLRDMGVKGFDPLLAFFCRKRDTMTGTPGGSPLAMQQQPTKEAPKP